MSGVTYWLQKQRKGELMDLAKYLGMKEYVSPHIHRPLVMRQLKG